MSKIPSESDCLTEVFDIGEGSLLRCGVGDSPPRVAARAAAAAFVRSFVFARSLARWFAHLFVRASVVKHINV